jgi:hypothetical protein
MICAGIFADRKSLSAPRGVCPEFEAGSWFIPSFSERRQYAGLGLLFSVN